MESQSLTFRRHNGDWFNLESNDLICAKTVNSTGANRVNGDKNLSVSSVISCSSIPEGRRHSKTGNAATKYRPRAFFPFLSTFVTYVASFSNRPPISS